MPETESKTVRFSDGWYPVDLTYNDEQPIVHFAKKAGPVFNKAFLKEEFKDSSDRVSMPLDSLQIDLSSRKIRPLHIVFHTSRCGSTLLTRMLNEIPDLRVISEPLALNELLSAPTPPSAELLKTRMQKVLFLLDLATPAEYSELLVKWGSWSVLCWELIASALPAKSMTFVWRDPVEVAVSILEGPPRWLNKTALSTIFNRYAEDHKPAHPGADAESAMMMISAMLRAGNAMPESTLKLCYKDLPEHIMTRMCAQIGRKPNTQIQQNMREVSTFSSKSNEKVKFNADSQKKRSTAPNDILYYADKILSEDLFSTLR